MYSKSRHGRDWLGVDINSGLSAQQSAGRDAQTAARPTVARYIYLQFRTNIKHRFFCDTIIRYLN